jgi:FkbM family methyltransferase
LNWTGISDKSLAGKILRLPLRLIPKGLVLPILQGPLRGKWWIVGSGNHGYWLGSYEFGKGRLFERAIRPGSVVYDLGGNVGYYSLLASVLAGPQGRVYTFEPLPRNLRFLREHLRRNGAANVTVYEAAVAERSGTAQFEEASSTSKGRLGSGGTLSVRTVALDDLVQRGELPPPDLLKVDVEGAELAALQGARKTLIRSHPVIFLSTHGSEVHRECCRFLESIGYKIRPVDGRPLERSRDLLAEFDRA